MLVAAVARSTVLDAEFSALQSELGALSKRQLQMDTMHTFNGTFFAKAKADLEQKTSEVLKALDTLRESFAKHLLGLSTPDLASMAASIGTSKFFCAFLMVSLTSALSGSIK